MQITRKTSYEKGLAAENKALFLLKKNHYEIIAQRAKTKHGEIDILAKKNQDYYIIEVKKRKNITNALCAINSTQIQRCINAFFEYAAKNNIEYEQIYIKVILIDSSSIEILNIDSLELII